jgi:hypothetical protein
LRRRSFGSATSTKQSSQPEPSQLSLIPPIDPVVVGWAVDLDLGWWWS